MPDVHVRQSDIERLARNLARLKHLLSRRQSALLSAILSVAADAIRRSQRESSANPLVSRVSEQDTPVIVKVQGSLPSIRDQFVQAFTPGEIRETHESPESVMLIHGSQWPPPPEPPPGPTP